MTALEPRARATSEPRTNNSGSGRIVTREPARHTAPSAANTDRSRLGWIEASPISWVFTPASCKYRMCLFRRGSPSQCAEVMIETSTASAMSHGRGSGALVEVDAVVELRPVSRTQVNSWAK